MKRFVLTAFLTALSMILLVCLSGCSDEEENITAGESCDEASNTASADGEALFYELIEPEEGRSVSLAFYGSAGEVYKVDKIVMSSDGAGTMAIDVAAASAATLRTGDGAVSPDERLCYTAEDMNFDGYEDFRIQAWQGSGENIPYFCFLWNNESKIFEYSFEMENPVFDSAGGRIYSTTYDGGKEYTCVYEFKDTEPVPVNGFESGAAVSFVSDLSAYEQYMNPDDRDGYLTLVNYENLLDGSWEPDQLYDLVNTRGDRAKQKMVPSAAMALEALYIEMNACGYDDVSVTSAYRSYERQSELFNSYINQEMAENGYTYDEALSVVKTYSAPPGTSEHQTGLCCDMHNLPAADAAFAEEEVYGWLCENSWKFGFILRFPEDKTDITKITFEPWHYRYVGRYHAEKITKLGMCLEEYADYLKLAG